MRYTSDTLSESLKLESITEMTTSASSIQSDAVVSSTTLITILSSSAGVLVLASAVLITLYVSRRRYKDRQVIIINNHSPIVSNINFPMSKSYGTNSMLMNQNISTTSGFNVIGANGKGFTNISSYPPTSELNDTNYVNQTNFNINEYSTLGVINLMDQAPKIPNGYSMVAFPNQNFRQSISSNGSSTENATTKMLSQSVTQGTLATLLSFQI